MTSLGPDALALLRRGKSSDEPDALECEEVVRRARERFEKEQTIDALERDAWPGLRERLRFGAARRRRKALVWTLAALVSSASVGAWGAWSGALDTWPSVRALWSGEQRADVGADGDLGAKSVARAHQDEGHEAAALSTQAADFPGAWVADERGEPQLQPKPELPGPAFMQLPRADGTTRSSEGTHAEPGSGLGAQNKAQPSTSRAASSLALELRLIASARNALATQDYSAALALADQHARTFPEGQLLPERLAIVALAHCHRNGDRSRARAFVARYRSSLFAARVSSECGLTSKSELDSTARPNNGVSLPDVAPARAEEDSSRGSF